MKFIDSNVFVYYLAGDLGHSTTARRILKRVEAGEQTVVPLIVINQVCAYLKAKGRKILIPELLGLLRSLPTLAKSETLFADFLEADTLQSRHDLDWDMWDDSVVAAQMARLKIAEIYSNDKDFDTIPDVQRIFT